MGLAEARVAYRHSGGDETAVRGTYHTPPTFPRASNATTSHFPALNWAESSTTLRAASPLGPAPMIPIVCIDGGQNQKDVCTDGCVVLVFIARKIIKDECEPVSPILFSCLGIQP